MAASLMPARSSRPNGPSVWSSNGVTIDLEPRGQAVKLTVTHEMERPGTRFIEAVSGGWPLILSNLKSLLETGEVAMQDKIG
jgi:hypothetical protein